MSKSPDEVSGLKLWLRGGVGMSTDTAGTTPVSADGQAIAHWADQSGQGNHVSQATSGNRPPYRPASTAGLDGLPSGQFDATNDALSGGTALQFSGKAGMTVFAVVHQATQASTNHGIVARDASGNRGYIAGMTADTGRAVWIVATSPTARRRRDGDKIDLRDLPCLLTFRFDGPAGEMSIRVNGADDTGAIDGSVPAAVGGDGATLLIGNDGFGEPFGGHIAEVAVYDVAVPDADRDDVEAHLLARHRLMGFREHPTDVSPDLDSHQGIASDGTHFYAIDTGSIFKRDASWSSVASNTSPFAGLPGSPNHLGDGTHHAGTLYVPMENWAACGTSSASRVALFDAGTLAYVDAFDISPEFPTGGASAVAVDPHEGLLYVASYCGDGSIRAYRLGDGTHLGDVALSVAVDKIQGMSYRAGALYLSVGTSATDPGRVRNVFYRVDPATGLVRPVYHDGRASTSATLPGRESEGIDFREPSRMLWLYEVLGGVQAQAVYALDVVYPATPPVAGVASLASVTATTATLSATAAAGDAHDSGWSDQWQRSDDGGATWGDLAGETSLTLADTGLTTGATYRYRLRSADGDSPPNIVYGNTALATPTAAAAPAFAAACLASGQGPAAFAT